MPRYEYACRKCGEHLEVVQAFTDDPLTECPACAGQLRKVFGSIGVTFKGSGFYKTDSRSSSGGKSKSAETSSDSSSSDSSSSTSSDSSSTPSSSSDSKKSDSKKSEAKTA
jgi:putative FmdB family regulatory protein